MNVKLLRQLSQRLLAPYGSQGHLRFESRRVVSAWASAHCLSCSLALLGGVRQGLHLSHLFKNPEPALRCVAFAKRRARSRIVFASIRSAPACCIALNTSSLWAAFQRSLSFLLSTPLGVVWALRRRTSAGVKERKQQKPDQEAADVRLPGNAAVHDTERRRSHVEQQIRRKPETQEQRRSPIPNKAQKALPRPVVGVVGTMPPWHGGEYEAGRRGHHP